MGAELTAVLQELSEALQLIQDIEVAITPSPKLPFCLVTKVWWKTYEILSNLKFHQLQRPSYHHGEFLNHSSAGLGMPAGRARPVCHLSHVPNAPKLPQNFTVLYFLDTLYILPTKSAARDPLTFKQTVQGQQITDLKENSLISLCVNTSSPATRIIQRSLTKSERKRMAAGQTRIT